MHFSDVPRLPRKLSGSDLADLRRELDRVRIREPARTPALAALLDHHERGLSLSEVAAAHRVSRRLVAKWVGAFRDGGAAALHPQTRGRKPSLSGEHLDELAEFVKGSPVPVSTVRAWLAERLGREVAESFARHWRIRAMGLAGVVVRKRKPRVRTRSS